MKICTYCKKEIDGNSVFCKHCGSRQSDNAPSPAPAPIEKKERKKIKLTKSISLPLSAQFS